MLRLEHEHLASCTTGMAVATGLGTIPAASTIALASMMLYSPDGAPRLSHTGVASRLLV
jgi:hypothetical protein